MTSEPVEMPPAPPPDASPAADEPDWDELVLGSFGPRHWNVGCG